MFVDTNDEEHKFIWENEENYTLGAKNYKKYMGECLSTPEKIRIWMSQRVLDENRIDRGVWLAQVGLPANAGGLEIFLRIHGVSINDCFWFNDTKDNSFWFNELDQMQT